MSAFEDFVQLELPKRPYLDADVAVESVIIRRGAGPRQLNAITLADGQVLGKVNGVLQGVSAGDGGAGGMFIKKHVESFSSSISWVSQHNLGTVDVIVQVFDSAGYVVLPEEIQVTTANVVTISFNTAQTGIVRIIGLS